MASNPPLSRTVQRVAIGAGRYASQGMISPTNPPFVDSEGVLTNVSFRFLHGLFQQINDLQTTIDALQQRLTTAGIP